MSSSPSGSAPPMRPGSRQPPSRPAFNINRTNIDTLEQDEQADVNAYWDIIDGLGTQVQGSITSSNQYRNIVNSFIREINVLIREIGINIEELRKIIMLLLAKIQELETTPNNEEELRNLIAQKDQLLGVINGTSDYLRQTLAPGGALSNPDGDLDPRQLNAQLQDILQRLQQEKLGTDQNIRTFYEQHPEYRRGGRNRILKRSRKSRKSRKGRIGRKSRTRKGNNNKRRSMKGGYMYNHYKEYKKNKKNKRSSRINTNTSTSNSSGYNTDTI